MVKGNPKSSRGCMTRWSARCCRAEAARACHLPSAVRACGLAAPGSLLSCALPGWLVPHLIKLCFLEQLLQALCGGGQHAGAVPQEVQDQAEVGGVPVDEDAALQARKQAVGMGPSVLCGAVKGQVAVSRRFSSCRCGASRASLSQLCLVLS